MHTRAIGKQPFGSQDMTVLYPDLCYSMACYNDVELQVVQ